MGKSSNCPEPVIPQNGYMLTNLPYQADGYSKGTKIDFECCPGYKLSGALHRTCQNGGTWSNEAAVTEGCQPHHSANSNVPTDPAAAAASCPSYPTTLASGMLVGGSTVASESTTVTSTPVLTTESITVATTTVPTTESITVATTTIPTTESITVPTTTVPTTESITVATTTVPTTESITVATTTVPTTQSITVATTPVPTTQSTTVATTPVPTTESTTVATTPVPTTESTTVTTRVPTTKSTTVTTTPVPTTESTTVATTPVPTTQSITVPTTPVPTTESITVAATPVPTTKSTTVTTKLPTTESTSVTSTPVSSTESTVVTTPVSITESKTITTTGRFTKSTTAATLLANGRCPEPVIPRNGYLVTKLAFNSAGHPKGTKIDFECCPGYNLKGALYRTCQNGGTWSNEAAVKEGCQPHHSANYYTTQTVPASANCSLPSTTETSTRLHLIATTSAANPLTGNPSLQRLEQGQGQGSSADKQSSDIWPGPVVGGSLAFLILAGILFGLLYRRKWSKGKNSNSIRSSDSRYDPDGRSMSRSSCQTPVTIMDIDFDNDDVFQDPHPSSSMESPGLQGFSQPSVQSPPAMTSWESSTGGSMTNRDMGVCWT